ncbi:MAG: phosphoribosylanthranilate isomerase [Janthinobacterium lividum]
MKIKICGMREAGNLAAIADLDPDFLGFIFYAGSQRCMRDALDPAQVRSLPPSICKVGVFVDADLADLQTSAYHYQLDYVQLHGHETPTYCQQVQALGLPVIKAFALNAAFDFSPLATYAPFCDFFLFDTKGELPGGNGTVFDWAVLRQYAGPTPFLLGGGLGLHNLPELLRLQHPQLYGFDFNSQLETAPGLKDVGRTRELLVRLHQLAA